MRPHRAQCGLAQNARDKIAREYHPGVAMTADEFVATLARISRKTADPKNEAMVRAWADIKPRPAPAFDHPPDPVLDLLARYDLSGVTFWQLTFAKDVPVRWDSSWQIAQKSTDDYYVDGGQLLKMYYKEAYPNETGLTSGQFLDLVALYAELIASTPPAPSPDRLDAILAEYAGRAATCAPHARNLDWFGEARAVLRERKQPVPLAVSLTLPGTLARAVVGYSIREPDPDVNPDDVVLPFLRKAAGRLVPKWTRSVRRFGETSVWGRGELGGEDVCDAEARVGTAKQHVHIRRHYSEPEQEMFPTARREYRWYAVCGLPEGLRLAVRTEREWRAGRLVCAEVSFDAAAPEPQRSDLERLFRTAFEARRA